MLCSTRALRDRRQDGIYITHTANIINYKCFIFKVFYNVFDSDKMDITECRQIFKILRINLKLVNCLLYRGEWGKIRGGRSLMANIRVSFDWGLS